MESKVNPQKGWTQASVLRKLCSPVGLSGTFVEGGITEPYLGGTRS